jgi:hypothetical protein
VGFDEESVFCGLDRRAADLVLCLDSGQIVVVVEVTVQGSKRTM